MNALLLISLTVVAGADSDWKQSAELNMDKAQPGQRVRAETPHFFLLALNNEPRLKTLGVALEKFYTTAVKGLEFESNNAPWKDKLTVYVLNDSAAFRSFVRQVEKRSPQASNTASSVSSGDQLHIVVSADGNKSAAELERIANRQLADVLLFRKSRVENLPDWFVNGFARATQHHGLPAASRKRPVAKLGLSAVAAWEEKVPDDKREQVAGSLVDYLIYGKGAEAGALLTAFRPPEGLDSKTMAQVLMDLELTPEKLDLAWRQWLNKP